MCFGQDLMEEREIKKVIEVIKEMEVMEAMEVHPLPTLTSLTPLTHFTHLTVPIYSGTAHRRHLSLISNTFGSTGPGFNSSTFMVIRSPPWYS